MASFLVAIISTLALFFIMAVDMADSRSHFCANVPPLEDRFLGVVTNCHVQAMSDKQGNVLKSCGKFIFRQGHNAFSGTSTLQGIDANNNFQQTNYSWHEVNDDFDYASISDPNPVAQVKAYKRHDHNAIVQSIIFEDIDGFIMAICPFPEHHETHEELKDIIICTWGQYVQDFRVNELLEEAKRLVINTGDVKTVNQTNCK